MQTWGLELLLSIFTSLDHLYNPNIPTIPQVAVSMTSGGAGSKHKGPGRVAQMFKAASSSSSPCVRMGEMSKESSGPQASQASSVLKVDMVCNISAESVESMAPAFKTSAAGAVVVVQ